MNQENQDLIKSINFANEFIKIVHGFKIDQERKDSLPQEIKEYLANEHLNQLIVDQDLEPEMLVWGLLHMINILLNLSRLKPDELVNLMEQYIERLKSEGDQNND